MKLAPILSGYLYQHKILQLAGIGKFLFDGEIHPESHSKSSVTYRISFENNPSQKDDEELISYISQQTGKMKALAASDLHSYVELAMEFLNIGKPFKIDGIGTLNKVRSGQFDFFPDHVLAENIKRPGMRELATTSSDEESFKGYDDIIGKPKKEPGLPKKVWVPLLLILGIGLAVGGGYIVYKKNVGNAKEPVTSTTLVADTTASNTTINTTPDSSTIIQTTPPGNFKFVYEVTNSKRRALSRYEQVFELNRNIRLEANQDSSLFKIYILLPATAADTARIKQELKAWYYGTKPRQITIEL